MEKLVKSHRFQTRLRELQASWKEFGVPMPVAGFKRVKDYHDWQECILTAYRKKDQSEEVAQAMKCVHDDPSIPANEKIRRSYEARERLLPPLPWTIIERTLEESGLDPKNEKYQYFLTVHIFLQQTHLLEEFFSIIWKENEKTKEMELFLKLEPHTKIEHIAALWKDRIAPEVKKLPGYVGKNKMWESFDDDLRIYTVHQKIKLMVLGKGKRSSKKAIDVLTWNYLRAKHSGQFRRLTLSQVRKSRNKVKKLDKNTPFKGTD